MFHVYFSNFGYFANSSFATLDAALAYAKSVHFEASIHEGRALVATWSPIAGTRLYR